MNISKRLWYVVLLMQIHHIRDQVLRRKLFFFDKKPILIKAWNKDLVIDRDVMFLGLDIKYWGASSLSKIGSLIGNPIMMDKQTKEMKLLDYARIIIEYRKKKWVKRIWVSKQLEPTIIKHGLYWEIAMQFYMLRIKLVAIKVTLHEIVNFKACLEACVLKEMKYTGSAYTWSNR
ncbi:hypothetical protein Cgig2_033140 [Carnegiea gigantea]|uniref:Uncharacterized protein n=1 Tax=Carnegiea gigantea TaxID=171969 RepID=A0A9Q1JLK9_9CARY|nr:hypothetical protein Cgig2_033140 [Carnegiea gigantea]